MRDWYGIGIVKKIVHVTLFILKHHIYGTLMKEIICGGFATRFHILAVKLRILRTKDDKLA